MGKANQRRAEWKQRHRDRRWRRHAAAFVRDCLTNHFGGFGGEPQIITQRDMEEAFAPAVRHIAIPWNNHWPPGTVVTMHLSVGYV